MDRSMTRGNRGKQDHEAMAADSKRSPIIYACALALATWLGYLAGRHALEHAGPLADYAADALWALAVFSAIGLFFPAIATWQATSMAFTLPANLKLGQLYQAPWQGAIGGTPVGLLVLGTE